MSRIGLVEELLRFPSHNPVEDGYFLVVRSVWTQNGLDLNYPMLRQTGRDVAKVSDISFENKVVAMYYTPNVSHDAMETAR